MARPRYKVLSNTFIAPVMYYPGSIIETDMEPGPHLDPLNAEAHARWEQWLDHEIEEKDDDGKTVTVPHPETGKLVPKLVRPHARYRIQRYVPGETPAATLIAPPPKQKAPEPEYTLAGQALPQRSSLDQRPGPDPMAVAQNQGETFHPAELGDPLEPEGVTTLSAAPTPTGKAAAENAKQKVI
jgi:hypothetical protein